MPTCACKLSEHACKLVVLTGGPGAGKTAVLEAVQRSFCRHIAVLPEAASILFGGGFPRRASLAAKTSAQRTIYHVQRELERMVVEEHQVAVALCDRGTVDGVAYWPEDEECFWREVGTARASELERYSSVIHLRTPSESTGYNQRNPVRTETAAQAEELDNRILRAWDGHPRRFIVENRTDFIEKLASAVAFIRAEVPECCRAHRIEGIEASDR